MNRITTGFTSLAALAFTAAALAHHGWSSFDETKPIYLEGVVKTAKWQNPHAELVLDVNGAAPPAALTAMQAPKQSANVDAAATLTNAKAPTRKDKSWNVELAPLARMDAWKVAEIKPSDKIAVIGYTFKDEKGTPTLRVEFLLRDGKVTPLRSAPM
jgi:hypothetical protein